MAIFAHLGARLFRARTFSPPLRHCLLENPGMRRFSLLFHVDFPFLFVAARHLRGNSKTKPRCVQPKSTSIRNNSLAKKVDFFAIASFCEEKGRPRTRGFLTLPQIWFSIARAFRDKALGNSPPCSSARNRRSCPVRPRRGRQMHPDMRPGTPFFRLFASASPAVQVFLAAPASKGS